MLRIATIGTSMITDDFIHVVNANDQAAFVGTLSRDADRGAAFTAERGGERNFTSLDELASADDVDAVYIGSPNALHYEQALACIASGKHVIVEKPFCATEAQALEVFRAAEAAGVVALEAMRPLHDPAFHAIEDALGEIAPIRRASLRFGKYSSRYNEILAGHATNIFDCNMASGSLMDIGVYTVEPMVEIFGMPSGLTSMTTLLDPATQQLTHGPIDGCGSILASYGGGRISVELTHSKITNDLLPSQIEGERGTIQIDHLSTPRNVRIDYRGDVVRGSATEAPREQGDNGRVLDLPKSSNTMEYELADFITAIGGIDNVKEEIWETPAGRHELGHYRDVTLVSLRIMDAVRQQAGIAFPADSVKQASRWVSSTSSSLASIASPKNPLTSNSSCAAGLPCWQVTKPLKTLPCAISCAGRGKSRASAFALPTPTSRRHAHSPVGCAIWKTARSRWRCRAHRRISCLSSRRFMPPTSGWGRVFASQMPRREPRLPMKTVSILVISIVC